MTDTTAAESGAPPDDDRPERWLMVLIVDREHDPAAFTPRPMLDPGETVARPSDWAWSDMVAARVEVVDAARLDPGDSVRLEVDDDARWLTVLDDGEVEW